MPGAAAAGVMLGGLIAGAGAAGAIEGGLMPGGGGTEAAGGTGAGLEGRLIIAVSRGLAPPA